MKKLMLFCCLTIATSAAAQKTESKTDRQLIAQLRADWTSYLEHKQLDKAADQYTIDAVFYSPGMAAITGKKAITALYQTVIKKYTSHCVFNSTNMEICGTMAFDSGSYAETMTEVKSRKAIKAKGNYLMTLKKEADGEWKISRIMWTEYK